MDDLMREIEAAVDGGAWVLALTATLALPDMCAAVEADDGQTTKARYCDWFRRYLAQQYARLPAEECYKMRCSLLHQGKSGGTTFSRLIFVPPVNGNVFHNNILNDALNLDLPTFCRDVIDAVRRWREDVRETEAFKRNAPTVIQWHPQGLAPCIVGVPVLG